MIVGRFAPSPTGPLHLGSVRTALVSWLCARQAGGRWLLHIDDLDRERSKAEFVDAAIDILGWLGLTWDGAITRTQPQLYEDALAKLEADKRVYPCSCTRRELEAISSAPHDLDGWGRGYPGTCRNGPTHPERVQALRFRIDALSHFEDAIAGLVTPPAFCDDFVVRRRDGAFAYQLAIVVDDARNGVTQVVRGDDLLRSTPRQIALHEALGLRLPQYAHVPLLVGPDGKRLAKRHGAIAVRDLRDAGWRPEEVLGWLAESLYCEELALRPAAARTLEELSQGFSLSNLRRGPTRVVI